MTKTWFEEGEESGKRAILLLLLETKFPGLSQPARQRLTEWPAEKLKELGCALLTAQSLEELGLEE